MRLISVLSRVTTSRGVGSTLAMAEYAVAGILYFAKSLHRTVIDRGTAEFDHRAYRALLIEGKTVCVVGTGGIGRDVGRLCAALGMRVVGTRRHPQQGEKLPPGFSEIGGAEDLDRFLPDSDFVAVCCQWTPETTRLFNPARFALMKPGAILVNVARGEIIDEDALFEALQQDRLRGVVLDVYVGEFERALPFKNTEKQIGYGAFAVRKDDQALLDALNAEIAKFIGTPEHLALVKPFGISAADLPAPGVTAEKVCAAQ